MAQRGFAGLHSMFRNWRRFLRIIQRSSALTTGEYAWYGSGGALLIGLGFKVVASGKYTDLDRKSTGTFTVQGNSITFHGGHLDGQTGRNVRGNKFVLGSMVSCEPFH